MDPNDPLSLNVGIVCGVLTYVFAMDPLSQKPSTFVFLNLRPNFICFTDSDHVYSGTLLVILFSRRKKKNSLEVECKQIDVGGPCHKITLDKLSTSLAKHQLNHFVFY